MQNPEAMDVFGIFAKQPVPGRVKTRIAVDLGEQRAADLAAAFVGDLAERFGSTADQRFLCYAPDDQPSRDYFQTLGAANYELWAQPSSALGERMEAFFGDAFAGGAKHVVVIGSDSPSLPVDIVHEAFEQLSAHDCVLGPATDGGYYLIGQRSASRPLFNEIEWGSNRVFSQTLERLRRAGASLALLPPWYDVDTLEALRMLDGHLQAIDSANSEHFSERTSRLLADLFAK